MAENGKIKNDMIRKYNQIDHFVELLEPMLKELAKSRNELKIVDCACGKSYLSFVLNYYLKEVMKINCRFTGIDIKEGVIVSSKAIAEKLGYRNMNFVKGDIRGMKAEQSSRILSSAFMPVMWPLTLPWPMAFETGPGGSSPYPAVTVSF